MRMRFPAQLLLPLLLLLLFSAAASAQKIVTTLPGYPGTLPFKLETGYVSVGENEEIQLFYYFIESQGNPRLDPLFLWHSGGPGCSAFSGLIYEIGPLAFDLENFNGSLPSLLLREYDWTKLASIIFLESPTLTGFSYDNTTKGYHSSDTENAEINYEFLRKWLQNHPSFALNPLYIAGDSYGGKIAVLVANEVAKGIILGHEPRMALKGYIIGNSINEHGPDCNARVTYAHGMALISDEHYQLARRVCNGNFFDPQPINSECIQTLHNIQQCMHHINTAHILEPQCNFATPRPIKNLRVTQDCKPYLDDDLPANFIFMPKSKKLWCRNQNYISSYVWANDPAVQEALGVRKGTVSYWKRCNRALSSAHIENVYTLIGIHRFLSDQGYQSLVFSGDHDMTVPYTSTLLWIRQLNLTKSEEWRPWNVNGQVAGYTMSYQNVEAFLTFATIKGAGHTAPEYMPEQCFAMMDRWLSTFPL